MEHSWHRIDLWFCPNAAPVPLRRHFWGRKHLRHHRVWWERLCSIRNDGNSRFWADTWDLYGEYPRYGGWNWSDSLDCRAVKRNRDYPADDTYDRSKLHAAVHHLRRGWNS